MQQAVKTPNPDSPRGQRAVSRLHACLLLVAIVTVGSVLTWVGCGDRPVPVARAFVRSPAAAQWPVEEEPPALASLSPSGNGIGASGVRAAANRGEAPATGATTLFADEPADPPAGSSTFAESLGLPSTPPTFAGAPELPERDATSVGASEPEAAVVDAALAVAAGAARRRPDDKIAAIETQVFGLTGRGSRFVYVFDRSLSMEGRPLAAAKRELLKSLSKLERVHQFQVVFYNENPKIMHLPDQSPQMMFADENGLRAAESFVTSIRAAGATDHVQALKAALRMGPDVIFFLTDADDPVLTRSELEDIREHNNGATINAIEFKSGPAPERSTLLETLAKQNGGEYLYVDLAQLPK